MPPTSLARRSITLTISPNDAAGWGVTLDTADIVTFGVSVRAAEGAVGTVGDTIVFLDHIVVLGGLSSYSFDAGDEGITYVGGPVIGPGTVSWMP